MRRLRAPALSLALVTAGVTGAGCPGTPTSPAADLTAGAHDSAEARDFAVALDGATAMDATVADLTRAGARDSAAPPVDAAGYPAGPYGYQEGQVVAPLAFIGYLAPDPQNLASSTYAPYSMDALRLGGGRYAMIHISDFY